MMNITYDMKTRSLYMYRSETRHGAGYMGDGVREGREALPPHDQGQPH